MIDPVESQIVHALPNGIYQSWPDLTLSPETHVHVFHTHLF